MSRIRDIANLFSANTDAATDAEVTSAVSTHAISSTSRHYKSGAHASRPVSPTAGDLYFNTSKKAFETWNGSEWISVAVNGAVPLAPTIGTATVSGLTGSVGFTGPTDFGDAAITTYTATSTPGSITGSGASSPISVSGLSANTSYTFTVTASNTFGTSLASSASNSITTADFPGAPTSVTVTDPGTDGYATVSWTAPASNGGSSITDYAVQYSSNSGSTWTTFSDGTSTSTSATVTGLTLGTEYIFRVAAINIVGTGSYSSASASFTPVAHDSGVMHPLQVITVGGTGTTSVNFTNIPNTYSHLQLRFVSLNASAQSVIMQFNGDTGSNYAKHSMNGNGSTGLAQGYSGQSYFNLQGYRVAASTPNPVVGIVDILDYSNTNKAKTARILSGFDANGTGEIDLNSGLWTNNNAITSILIRLESNGTINQHSQFALYGVKST